MIEGLALARRSEELDRKAFREHVETVLAPLVGQRLDALSRFVRYHVESERVGRPGFDVVASFGLRDPVASGRFFEAPGGEAGAALRAEAESVVDASATRSMAVSRRLWLAGSEGDESLFVVVARPEGMLRSEASARLARDHWPRLLASFEEPSFALLREAFPLADAPPPCDALMQVGAVGFGGLERWSRAVEAEGFAVVAVTTQRFETSLGAVAGSSASEIEAGA